MKINPSLFIKTSRVITFGYPNVIKMLPPMVGLGRSNVHAILPVVNDNKKSYFK